MLASISSNTFNRGMIKACWLVFCLLVIIKIIYARNQLPTSFISPLPESPEEIIEDKRPQALEKALEEINSPLAGKGVLLVNIADDNGLDYRLLPAIAFAESTACRHFPRSSNNCLGWGNPLWEFASVDAGFREVAQRLATSRLYAAHRNEPGNLYTLAKIYNQGDTTHWVAKIEAFYQRIGEI